MPLTRDFTVAIFVIWQGRVALHQHQKLRMWLPPGGHIEANELPDQAAMRETLEETGVRVTLLDASPIHGTPGPQQLATPRGIQLEDIGPDHQHIDLIYFAAPVLPYDGTLRDGFAWYDHAAVQALEVSQEVQAWCTLALQPPAGQTPAGQTLA